MQKAGLPPWQNKFFICPKYNCMIKLKKINHHTLKTKNLPYLRRPKN
jgi:hypothetical protein